jgi:hypothetical protein
MRSNRFRRSAPEHRCPSCGEDHIGVLFSPSTPMPRSTQAVEDSVWYAVWPSPWDSASVLAPLRSVFLVDAEAGVVEWQTEITDVVAVPFESVDAFRDLIARRWGHPVTRVTGTEPRPGWGVAWRAAPVRHLGVSRPEGAEALRSWDLVSDLDEVWRTALGYASPLPESDLGPSAQEIPSVGR